MIRSSRKQRLLSTVVAVLCTVAVVDGVTYASTGSSLILGRLNKAGTTTVIQNTGSGAAVRLVTKSIASPAFTTNAKGKVVNLYADRANTANSATSATNATNATKLGGQTLDQVKAAVGARPARVIWVAASGGDFSKVSAALASITDNDATHPYVIKIAPGTYTEGAGLALKTYVALEGSGRDITTITCACGRVQGTSDANMASTVMIDGAETTASVQDLTLENTVAGQNYGWAIAVRATTGAVSIDRVALRATGAATAGGGALVESASPTFHDVVIDISNPIATVTNGVYVFTDLGGTLSQVGLDDVTVHFSDDLASFGLRAENSLLTVRNSDLEGPNGSISNLSSTVQVLASILRGPLSGLGGTYKCTAVVDAETFLARSSTCA